MNKLAVIFCPLLLLAQTDAEKLHRIFAEEHAEYLKENPLGATRMYGRQPGPGRWNDESLEGFARRRERYRARLAALRALRPDALSGVDRFNHELLIYGLAQRVDLGKFPSELLALSNRFASPAYYLPGAFDLAPAENAGDYEKMLDLLRGIPARLEQQTALLERGVRDGIVQPEVAVRAVPAQLDALTSAEPARSPLLEVFRRFPKSIPQAEQDRLSRQANAIVDAQVIPALRKFRTYVADQYIPRTTKSIARSALPNGKDWYAADAQGRPRLPARGSAHPPQYLPLVDQNIGRPEGLLAFGEQAGHCSGIPHAGLYRNGLTAFGFDDGDNLVCRLLAPRIVDHHFRAFAGKASGDPRNAYLRELQRRVPRL